jgi:hypothetical protein
LLLSYLPHFTLKCASSHHVVVLSAIFACQKASHASERAVS